MEKILKQSIERIDIDVKIIEILKESGIITIKDLTSKSKTDLKNLTLSFQEINKIQIELQLLGLNLKGGLLAWYIVKDGKFNCINYYN